MNMQGNAFQSQLKAFTVLQSVVLKLYSACLGPCQGQGAAFFIPASLKKTITKCEQRRRKCLSMSVTECVWAWSTDLFRSVSIFTDSLHRNNVVLHVRPGSHNPAQDSSHLKYPRHYIYFIFFSLCAMSLLLMGWFPGHFQHEVVEALTWRECDTAKPTMPGLSVFFPITERMAAAKTTPLPTNSRLTASHLWK